MHGTGQPPPRASGCDISAAMPTFRRKNPSGHSCPLGSKTMSLRLQRALEERRNNPHSNAAVAFLICLRVDQQLGFPVALNHHILRWNVEIFRQSEGHSLGTTI